MKAPRFWQVCCAVIGGAVGSFLFTATHAQKKDSSYPQTRVWLVTNGANGASVSVIDTAGVCLYVANNESWNNKSPSIAAVPKTQLPPGAGCQ